MQTRSDFPVTLKPSDIQKICRTGRVQAYNIISQAKAQALFPVHNIGKALKIPRDPFFDWWEGRPAQQQQTKREEPRRFRLARPKVVIRFE